MSDADALKQIEVDAAEEEAKPSRSQIKRDHLALQTLAEQLLALPRDLLRGLSLGESTWAAIDETARIKDRRALRRHYKRIANCLARENTEPLQSLLEQRAAQDRQAVALQHQAERWRVRLLEQGDEALAELIEACPEIDRQQLRSLVRAARRDAERGRPEAPRRLFRFIRGVLEPKPSD
jgi:ribosome-associated protein